MQTTKSRKSIKIKPEDEVITRIAKAGIPAGTFGVVAEIEDENIWVDVYIPAESDVPEDTIRYLESELELQ